MNTFCTIINKAYLPYARVLFNSIASAYPGAILQVLVTDIDETVSIQSKPDGITLLPGEEVLKTEISKKIYQKYAGTNTDHLRWALKPVFLLYLLNKGFDKVIFIDPDMYFTGNSSFLFNELDSHNILLAPHNSIIDPLIYEDGLFAVLRNGLFSGGFVGANQNGKKALTWWAEVCHYKIAESKELGLFVDQKYLDLFPLIDSSTTWLKHPGCNLENINSSTQKRELVNGKVKINKAYDPVFIHFTKDTITNIENGNDAALQPFLAEYKEQLIAEGYDKPVAPGIPVSVVYTIKRRLLLRTRLKRFFFRLAEKL
ncbi:MAG: hypothetical protein JSU05_08345 [Bacteroidetes bacterium]|nr:hypothetical protein [Bacteroidota bacterium]